MSALLLGLVLIIGYRHQSKHPIHLLTMRRTSGYNIYFTAGMSGLKLFFCASLIWLVFDLFDSPTVLTKSLGFTDFLQALNLVPYTIELKFVLIVVLMATISQFSIDEATGNIRFNKDKYLEEMLSAANENEKLIITAAGKVEPLRVVLDSGKVYVGIPEKPNLDKGEVSHLTLLPLLSGYLDEKLQLQFTNSYLDHYDEYYSEGGTPDDHLGHSDIRAFIIVIKLDEVSLISHFNFDSYKKIHHSEVKLNRQSELKEARRSVYEKKCKSFLINYLEEVKNWLKY